MLVSFAGDAWADELRKGVLEHLRAGLGPAGFRVCDTAAAAGRANVATVELRQNAGERVTATIEVRDGVTAKRVARDIDLSALPEDARALGVGVAADELLRASWVELSLAGAPKPAEPPPPTVKRVVETSLRVQHPARSELGVLFATGGYTSGLFTLGGDIVFRQQLGRVLGLGLTLGLRQSPAESAPHGKVSASLFGAGGSLFAEVVRLPRLRVSVDAGLFAAETRLRGEARAFTVGKEASSIALVARASAVLTFPIAGPLLLLGAGGAGIPLRSVVARDYGANTVGVKGFEWSAALGPAVEF